MFIIPATESRKRHQGGLEYISPLELKNRVVCLSVNSHDMTVADWMHESTALGLLQLAHSLTSYHSVCFLYNHWWCCYTPFQKNDK